MSAQRFNDRKLIAKVLELSNQGRFKEARKLVQEELDLGASVPKRRRKRLLDTLVMIELSAKKPKRALEYLAQRRALRYSNWTERLNESLRRAQIYTRVGKWFEARAELTELLRDKNCLRFASLLRALELYVEVDGACREEMEQVLAEASAVAIRSSGIPVTGDEGKLTTKEKIKSVSAVYRTAAKGYEALLLRTFDAASPESRKVLVGDIQTYLVEEKVKFFNGLARELLDKLGAQGMSKEL
jgi:hypothetical protein